MKNKKYLTAIRFLYYALFLLTPVVMSSKTSEMFEFNKMMLIYLVAVSVSGLYSIHYILHRQKLYLPLLLHSIVAFLSVQLISTVFSIDRTTSIWGYYGRWNGGVVSTIAYMLLVFVFIQVFTKRDFIKLLNISLVSAVLVVLWALPALLGHDLSCLWFTGSFTNACWTAQFQPAVRMFSTVGQPNWLGAFLAVQFFIAAYFLIHELIKVRGAFTRSLKIYIYGASILLISWGLIATKSRSSMIAVGVSVLIGVVIILTRKVLKPQLRLLYRTVLIGSLLLTTYIAIGFASTSFSSDVPPGNHITDSYTIRQIVWSGALKLGLKHPLVGTGPETFAYSYFQVKPVLHNRTSEWDLVYNKAHNEFLNMFATMGFPGILSYGALIIFSYWYISQKSNNQHSEIISLPFMLVLAFTTVQITNFFGFSTSTLQLFLFLLPAGMSLYLKKKNDETLTALPPRTQQVLISLVLIAVCGSLWQLGMMYKADTLYKQAQRAVLQDEYAEASQLLVHAMKLKHEHVYEDKLSSARAQLAFISSFDTESAKNAELIELSRASNADTLRRSPENVQYWRTRAKNEYLSFQITGDTADLETAVESMRYTTILAPHDAQSFYMLGLFYSLIDQEEPGSGYAKKAHEALSFALELRPNYIEARELMR